MKILESTVWPICSVLCSCTSRFCSLQPQSKASPIAFYLPQVNGIHVYILVDSGAAGNFIARHLLEKLSLQTIHSEMTSQITFANGTQQTTLLQTLIPIIMSDSGRHYKAHIKATVLDLPGQEIILGKRWLQEVNPRINWTNDYLSISTSSGPLILKPTKSGCPICSVITSSQELNGIKPPKTLLEETPLLNVISAQQTKWLAKQEDMELLFLFAVEQVESGYVNDQLQGILSKY